MDKNIGQLEGGHSHDGTSPAQYPQGQYPQGPYSQAQYPQAQYPQAQYPQSQYPQGQYPLGQNPQGPPPVVTFKGGNPPVTEKNTSPPAYSQNDFTINIPLKNATEGYTHGVYVQGGPEGNNHQGQFGYPGFQPNATGDANGAASNVTIGEDEFRVFDFTEQSIRKAFVRKVYAILMCQLLVTMSFIAVFVFYEPTKTLAQRNPVVVYSATGVSLVCVIVLACCENVRRQSPMNLIFLGIFTLAEGFMLGAISSLFDSDTIMMTVGLTVAICFSLTVFAMQTKWDFTAMGGILICSLVVLILFGIVTAIVGTSNIMRILYACGGALIFSVYLVYDTQLMLGGKHKYTISPEEYIFAALNIYLDIINLYLYLLRLMASR